MDDFERRWFPVEGREFTERSGKWRCELDGPVDVTGVDLRVFHLRFVLLEKDPRWTGAAPSERKLQLKTSLASFHNVDGKNAGYAGWLSLVIDGFLDGGKTDDVIEALEIERGSNQARDVNTVALQEARQLPGNPNERAERLDDPSVLPSPRPSQSYQRLRSLLTALDEQDDILSTAAAANPTAAIPIPHVATIKGVFEDIRIEFPDLIRELDPHGNPGALRAQIRAARARILARIEALEKESHENSTKETDREGAVEEGASARRQPSTSAQINRITSALIDGDEQTRSRVLRLIATSTSLDLVSLAVRLRSEISGPFNPKAQNFGALSARDSTLIPSIRSWMFSALIWADPESPQTRELVSRHLRGDTEPERNVRFWILAGLYHRGASYVSLVAEGCVNDAAPEVAALAQVIAQFPHVAKFREMLRSSDFNNEAWPVLRVLRVIAIPELVDDVSALLLRAERGTFSAYDSLFALSNPEMAQSAAQILAKEPGTEVIVIRTLEESLGASANARREFASFLAAFDPATVDRTLSVAAGDPLSRDVVVEIRRFLDEYRRHGPASAAGPSMPGYSSETINIGDDRLDIRQDVQTLIAVMLSKDVTPPLAIGLFGDWGSGKSFFMRSMRAAADRLAKRAQIGAETRFCKDIVSIEFNAWHYADSHLLASLVSYILRELAAYVSPQPTAEEARAKLVSELSSARSAREEAENEKKLAEGTIQEREKQLEEFRRARYAKELELSDLRVSDLKKLLAGQNELKQKIETSLDQLGLPAVLNSTADFARVVGEAFTTRGQAAALLTGLITPKNRRLTLFLLVSLLAVIPAIVWWLSTLAPSQAFFLHASGILSQVAVAVSGATAIIAKALKHVKEQLAKLAAAKQQVDDLITEKKKISLPEEINLENQIAALTLKEQQAASRLSTATARVLELQEKMQSLENGQSLGRFLADRVDSEDYRKHLGLISVIRQDFEALADRLNSRKLTDGFRPVERIILYIDDLDRCPSHKVMEVLEAVHLLLAYPLFIVVVGVDPRWLLNSLRETFTAFGDAKRMAESNSGLWETTPQNYLEKIFQIPFTLRPMTSSGYGRLMESLLSPSSAVRTIDRGVREVARPNEGQGGQSAPQEPASAPSPPPAMPQGEPDRTEASSEFEVYEESLVIKSWEKGFADRLFPLIPSPRAAKRFSNIYRILKAPLRQEEIDHFEGTAEGLGDFQVPMLLLAILVGLPIEAAALFPKLQDWAAHDNSPTEGLKDFALLKLEGVELSALQERIRPIVFDDGFPQASEIYREWLPRVSRFSFGIGRMLH